MGKYMRKAKTTGEVAVMEISQSSLGVRTRAKTLALQRLQKSMTAAAAVATPPANSGSYLQLRSRRLEKPPILVVGHDSKRQKHPPKEGCVQNPNPNPNPRTSSRLRVGSVNSGSVGSVSLSRLNNNNNNNNNKEDGQSKEVTEKVGKEETQETNNNNDVGIEASFGENFLEFEGRERERGTRESTPCSLIRDPDTIRTPGSATRPTSSAETNRRIQNRRHIPTAHEMDEFFTGAEEQQQRQFIEKYNFDPVKDKPLPGRYEWVKLDP